jgi:hypothetical protein
MFLFAILYLFVGLGFWLFFLPPARPVYSDIHYHTIRLYPVTYAKNSNNISSLFLINYAEFTCYFRRGRYGKNQDILAGEKKQKSQVGSQVKKRKNSDNKVKSAIKKIAIIKSSQTAIIIGEILIYF